MADEATDAAVERPKDGDRLVKVKLDTLERVIGLLSATVEDRRGSTEVIEEIRRRLGTLDHPAGSDVEDGD